MKTLSLRQIMSVLRAIWQANVNVIIQGLATQCCFTVADDGPTFKQQQEKVYFLNPLSATYDYNLESEMCLKSAEISSESDWN